MYQNKRFTNFRVVCACSNNANNRKLLTAESLTQSRKRPTEIEFMLSGSSQQWRQKDIQIPVVFGLFLPWRTVACLKICKAAYTAKTWDGNTLLPVIHMTFQASGNHTSSNMYMTYFWKHMAKITRTKMHSKWRLRGFCCEHHALRLHVCCKYIGRWGPYGRRASV